jgi:poly-gamma-glutamate synthesis protein (capsule biosynthesis protein)
MLVDKGADVVLGHHPHRIQGIEFYESKKGHTGIICYSLGNFIFDQNDHLNNLSIVLGFDIYEKKITSLYAFPIEMLTYPRAVSLATGLLKNETGNLLKEISKPFGTNVYEQSDYFIITPE